MTVWTENILHDAILCLAIEGAKGVIQNDNVAASIDGPSECLQSCQEIHSKISIGEFEVKHIPLAVVVPQRGSIHDSQSRSDALEAALQYLHRDSKASPLGYTNQDHPA